jgi:RNA polymerase sigma factor (sigma-70 family)
VRWFPHPGGRKRSSRRIYSTGRTHSTGSASLNADSTDAFESSGPADLGPEERPFSVEKCIRRYHDILIGYLRRRLGTLESASDVAQETYIQLLKYQGADDVRSARALVFHVATNIAIDRIRAEAARRASSHQPIDTVEVVSDQPSAERVVSAEQDLALLMQAITDLPPKCKRVFLLSRDQCMTHSEIAAHCRISVKMVEKHITSALAACLKKLNGVSHASSNTTIRHRSTIA